MFEVPWAAHYGKLSIEMYVNVHYIWLLVLLPHFGEFLNDLETDPVIKSACIWLMQKWGDKICCPTGVYVAIHEYYSI